MTESGDDEQARALLADCIEEPARAKRRLPAVVRLLEADDPVARLGAAWACCLVTETHPETVEYVLDRLGDRLAEEEGSPELTHALQYLADRHPAAVESALATEATGTGDASPSGRSLPEPGPITRDHSDGTGPDRPGVGRVRYPDASGADDPRQTYTVGGPDERERAATRAELAAADDDAPGDSTGDPASSTAADATETGIDSPADGAEEGADRADGTRDGDDRADGALVEPTADVSTIAAASRFDQLHVLAAQARSRFSEDYRALVGSDGEDQAIVLRLLDRPADAPPDAFDADAREVLDRWAAVDDHPNLVGVLDWGIEPRPWLATTFAG
jgi:hypothetical protein